MLRFALSALLVLLLLVLLVAFLPTPRSSDASSVELSGVKMRLYPRTEEKGVVWLFGVKSMAFDPASRESTLSGLEQGKRLGKGKLDMTLETKTLTIDQNDTLFSDFVTLTIPKECTTFTFGQSGTPRAVMIDQNSGFSGPNVRYKSADAVLSAKSVQSDFALKNLRMPGARFLGDLDAPVECRKGKIVSVGKKRKIVAIGGNL